MHKKLLVIVIALLLALVAAVVVLPMFVDRAAIKDEIIARFKMSTGLNLEMQGEPVVHLLPLPHVTIDDLYVANTPVASTSFLMAIKSVNIRLSLISLFSAKPALERVDINGLDIELERLKGGEMNWRERARQSSIGGVYSASVSSLFTLPAVNVTDGVVHFTDVSAGIASEYKDISLSLTTGGPQGQGTSFAAKLNFAGIPLTAKGQFGTVLSGIAPANVQIQSGKSILVYEGDAGVKDDDSFLKGNVKLDMDDISTWISAILNDRNHNTSKQYTPLPLQAKGEMNMEGGTLSLPALSLNGAVVKGNLQVALKGISHLEASGLIDTLDLEAVSASRVPDIVLKDAAATPQPGDIPGAPVAPVKTFLDTFELDTNVQVADALYNNQHIRDSHFGFILSDGEMNISQASSLLPGDSRVIFTGLGKQGPQGFELEGQIDAAGNSFFEMLRVFKAKGFALPPQDFARFRVKTNAVISAQEVQLSELAARIENMGFVGGGVAISGPRTQIKSSLRIGGVNLDHFVTLWGLEEWRASFLNESLAPKKEGLLSQWLKLLDYDLQLNASLEKYVLGGKPYDKSEFKLNSTRGKIAFDYLNAAYNGTQLTGKASLSVMESPPRADIDFTADTVDLPLFLGRPVSQEQDKELQPSEQHWSHAGFDFHGLELVNGAYHLHTGHFKNGLLQADNVDVKGSIESGTLKVDALTAETMGAQVSGKVTLVGARIPMLTVIGEVLNLDAEQLSAALPSLKGMVGRYNLDVHLDTSGIDTFSWASSLEGAVGVAARDIVVHDFDLPGIIQALTYVRTTADILDAVRHAFPGGQTVFSSAGGQWEVRGGVLRTANMKMANARSMGLYSGEVDIVNWKTHGQITFDLKSLDSAHPPSIALSIAGGLGAPQKTLDTHVLEQYVTGKTSERMLNQYGH